MKRNIFGTKEAAISYMTNKRLKRCYGETCPECDGAYFMHHKVLPTEITCVNGCTTDWISWGDIPTRKEIDAYKTDRRDKGVVR